MRSRARVMVPVVSFAVAVALVAALAGRGGDGQKLVKLPVGSMGAAGEADAAATTTIAPTARSSMAYAPGVEYKIQGTLPHLPDRAPGYRLSDAATEDAIRKLAGVLSIDGSVRMEESSWVVQDGDRSLRVMKVPGLPWYVEPSCPDAPLNENEKVMAVACAGVAVGVAAPATGAAGSSGALPQDMPATTVPLPAAPAVTPSCPPGAECVVAEPAPAPVCAPDATCTKPAIDPMPPVTAVAPPDRPARPEGFPTRAEAEKLARDTFAKLGAGSEGMVVEDGWATWEARVGMRLDGLEVLGMDTTVSIGAHGVERANGWLAAPERIGDYPLVGIEAGFKRLTTPPPVPATRLVAPAPPVATGDAAGVATEEPSTTMVIEPMPPMMPYVQTIVGVHLALLNTGQALVPAYVFELDGGGTIPVPAVTNEWLDTTGSPGRD